MKRRRSVTITGAMLLGGVAIGALPGAAAGCSAGLPSAAEVRDGASTIALVRVEEVQGDPAYPTGYTIHVLQEIKGDLGDRGDLPALQATLCGDTISVLDGTRMVVALNLPFRGRTIAPYWIAEADDTISGGAGRVPTGGMSLDELIVMLGGMPDTSVVIPEAPAAPRAGWTSVLAASSVLVGLWFAGRKVVTSRRSARHEVEARLLE